MVKNKWGLVVPIVAGIVLIGTIFALVGGLMAMERVDAGEERVVKYHGETTGDVFEPGLNWRTPLIESTESVDVRPQTYSLTGSEWDGDTDSEDSIRIITQDGQEVDVDVTVRYRVTDSVRFHEEYNNHQQATDRLIRPTVQSVIRDEGSDQSVRKVITREGRVQLEEQAFQTLNNQSQGSGVQIEAVQVRDVTPNPAYQESLERIEIAQAYAEEEVIRAEADAEAFQIRDQELTDEVLIEMWIEQLDETDTIYVPAGDGTPDLIRDVDQD